MNKHYYHLFFVGFLSLVFSIKANACGYAWISDCSSQVHLRINGRLDSFNIADCPSGYRFDGLQLGNLQSLSLANAKSITWESCQNNVSAVQLRYRVYEEGAPGGPWLSLNLQEYHQTIEGPYTTRYRSAPSNITLTNGLIIGKKYTVEVYLLAEVDTIGDDFIPETSFLRNNNGSNYKLSFTYGGVTAPPIALLAHLTEPSCHGGNNGNISVVAYGDLTGVFYQWSNVSLNFYQQYNMAAGIYAITVTNAFGHSAVDTMVLGQPTPLQTTFSNVQSVGCNNSPGTATVAPNGGTPPYQYHWENGQQTQMATLNNSGQWKVTVTDSHQCTDIGSVLIGNTGQVERTFTAEICVGENYQFGNQTFTFPGLYTFTIPGIGGCDTLVKLTINRLDPGAVFTSLPNAIVVTCNQPSVELCAVPMANTSYLWLKDGVSASNTPCLIATAGGQYTLQATTVGTNKVCTAEQTVTSEEHLMVPSVWITGQFNVTCAVPEPTGWIVANTQATSPTFSWLLNGVEVSTADSFFVQHWAGGIGGGPVLPNLTVIDVYGCENNQPTTQIALTQNLLAPILELAATDASSALNSDGTANVEISTGQEPYQVLWSTGSANQMISGLTPGVYCVTVTGSNGCSDSSCVVVHYLLSTQNGGAENISIFPNPITPGALITLSMAKELPFESTLLELINVEGVVLQSAKMESSLGSFTHFQPSPLLDKGLYFIRLTSRNKAIIYKIMVE